MVDTAAVRAQSPALAEGAAHFDGPGGTHVPACVADAVAGTLTSSIANRGPATRATRRADDIVLAAREALADLTGAPAEGVVFGRSMTALTYDIARALAKEWGPGDEVVVSRLDHDANIRPWVTAAEAVGATARWASLTERSRGVPHRSPGQICSPPAGVAPLPARGAYVGGHGDSRHRRALAR